MASNLLPGGPTATINVGETGGFPDPYKVTRQKEEQLRRRRLAAQRLIEESQQKLTGSYTPHIQGTAEFGPLPQQYVAPSWTEHLAQGLQRYGANEELKTLDKEGQQLDIEAADAARAADELTRRLTLQDRGELWAREDNVAADKAEADRIAALSKQEREVIEAEKKRQHEIALRKIPQTVIRNTNVTGMPSGGGGKSASGGGGEFGGVASQVGVDPRDGTPVYRHKDSNRLFKFDEGGQGVLYTSVVAPKPSATEIKARNEAEAGVNAIDDALTQIEATPDAFGYIEGTAGAYDLGSTVLNTLSSEEEIAARASVANIGSQVIHDRSGAAVTIAETPRLKPFIPFPTDDAKTAAAKLRQMRKTMEADGYTWGAPEGSLATAPAPAGKTVVREVKLKDGRTGVEYSDGSRGYK